jgi:hypothetical protein
VLVREGYDMGEVDAFLDRLCERLAEGRAVTKKIDKARFTPVRLREGYDMEEVALSRPSTERRGGGDVLAFMDRVSNGQDTR